VNETFARQIEHLRKPFGNVVVAGLVAMLLMMMMLFQFTHVAYQLSGRVVHRHRHVDVVSQKTQHHQQTEHFGSR
jgi:hypothetical protein